MALFLSTHINKVDKKGRVSVPAQFRAALAQENFQGIVVFPSQAHAALEGFAWSYMEEISRRLENFDLFSAEQDDMATTVFAESVQLPFDGEGRIVLPENLIALAGLEDRAAFVGLGNKFQIWNVEQLEKRREEARSAVRQRGLTLPKNDGPKGGSV